MLRHREKTPPKSKEKGLEQMHPSWTSQGTNPVDTLILDVQPPEPQDSKCCLIHLVCGTLLWPLELSLNPSGSQQLPFSGIFPKTVHRTVPRAMAGTGPLPLA